MNQFKATVWLLCIVLSICGCQNAEIRSTDVESRAPKIELHDISGKTVSLNDFSGKLVLLNFWATWCAPCVAEMPALENLYQKYKARGLEIVAISVDPVNKKSEIKSFIENKSLNFAILLDPDFSVVNDFGVTGFPETFFINKEGNFINIIDPKTGGVAKKVIGDAPWDTKPYFKLVEELLAK